MNDSELIDEIVKMKLIIDLPNKTIAHIRSDYGHKYFGCIGDEDKKIIMKAIYDGTLLSEELEKIKAEIKPLRYGSDTYKHAIDDVFEILDNRIAELKGENK